MPTARVPSRFPPTAHRPPAHGARRRRAGHRRERAARAASMARLAHHRDRALRLSLSDAVPRLDARPGGPDRGRARPGAAARGLRARAPRARRGRRPGERREWLRLHPARRAHDHPVAHAAQPARGDRPRAGVAGAARHPRVRAHRASHASVAQSRQAAALVALARAARPHRDQGPSLGDRGIRHLRGRQGHGQRPTEQRVARRADAPVRHRRKAARLRAAQRDQRRLGDGQLRLPRGLGVSRMARAPGGRLESRRPLASHDGGHRPFVRAGLHRRVRRVSRRAVWALHRRADRRRPRRGARDQPRQHGRRDARPATDSRYGRSRCLARRSLHRAHHPAHRRAQPARGVEDGGGARHGGGAAPRGPGEARPRRRPRSRVLPAPQKARHLPRRHRRRAVRDTALVQ